MPTVDVRLARVGDVGAVLALWSTAAENANRPVDTRAAVLALLDRDPTALLVAESADEIIGSIIAGWDGWRGHLYRLAVHPDHRRQGVAAALLAAAEARLGALGAVRFDAMVLGSNEAGHQLWHSAGYRRQDDWGRWVKSA
jgi:ribosomal protein S18 acetylase RimI-like enzyme